MRSSRKTFGFRPGGGVLLAGLIMSCLGCGAEPPLLYCGAGIKPPVAELVEAFRREQGADIVCDYRGSEMLLSSVMTTRTGDLYIPGDVHYLELAEKEGLIASKRTVCYFVPVILVQKDNPKEIHSLKDLTRREIAVGLGDPQFCAIGRTSSKIFEKNGIREDDVHVTFRSATAPELANHIELGSLDVVILWDAVAAYVGEKGEIVRIPPEQNIISTVAVGILKSSRHPELAAEFVEFITSERGRKVFEKHHYTVTPPE